MSGRDEIRTSTPIQAAKLDGKYQNLITKLVVARNMCKVK